MTVSELMALYMKRYVNYVEAKRASKSPILHILDIRGYATATWETFKIKAQPSTDAVDEDRSKPYKSMSGAFLVGL